MVKKISPFVKYVFLLLAALAVVCFIAAFIDEKKRKKHDALVDNANELIDQANALIN